MSAVLARAESLPPPVENDVLAAEVFGRDLPIPVEHHLREAGRAWHQAELAEWHLGRARALAPDHAAVLIAHYRYYFYKNRLAAALGIARECLAKAAREIGVNADWHAVRATDASFDTYEAVLPRFYLFTLKGYAYLQLRLGNLEEGRAAAAKLLELDPTDRMGASVLLGVIGRRDQPDDD
jgi:tetratricopeptide (TPR) repeat protein